MMFLLAARSALAQYGLEETGEAAGIPSGLREATVSSLAGQIIGIGLGIVGVIFLLLMVYGGFLWMTARGNDQQVKEAKNLIIAASIGIIIIAAAYVVANFVIGSLANLG